MQNHLPNAELSVPSVDDSLNMLLALMLSIIAGSVEAISFLGLGELLTAHITGNVVVLAVRLLAHAPVSLSCLMAVPIFMVVLGITSLLVAALARIGLSSLLPLLALQFLLLLAFLNICLIAGPQADPNTATMIFGGMLGVSAMAVQSALIRICRADASASGVMTTNVTVLATDVVEIFFGQEAGRIAKSRNRAKRTLLVILGFVLGCALGVACEPTLGLKSLQIPTVLALIAFVLGLSGNERWIN
jgi:uncharacterized membrane protein YoaK (UPF0700 family)